MTDVSGARGEDDRVRKLPVLAVLLALCLGFGFRQPALAGHPVRIGVSLLSFKNQFIWTIKEAMEAKARELKCGLIVSDGQDSAEKQVSQVENFIARKVAVVILNPVSMDGCKPAVEAANTAGIPIVTVNTLVANQEKCAAFVGSDAVESGRLEMEYAARLLHGRGNLAILHGQLGHDAQIGRRKGAQEVLNGYPNLKVIFEQSGNWSRVEGMAIMENWLEAGKPIQAVVSQNDEMALGALKAIEAAGMAGQILVFGIDAIPGALKAMREGRMAGTVFQDAKGQGAGSVAAAVKIARGQAVEKRIYIPYRLVTGEDLNKYLR